MDAGLMKLLTDAGTVAIVVFLLIKVLAAYMATVSRVTDMLENEIKENDDEK